ncbi:TRAP transporter substrate-binding protein [Marinomonas mediterranea]|uniref:TRAP transporter substrate-binding protein n=1 Tax=Marinomonas mediterranea TaxID=119864 RepID=UPI00234A3D48|nr:TRAP transporter substrate-binding protein [Marinomonas mediterranea]WCN08601.1 C4-dicarboxylate ABC transporter substrate-binding protein [Marinomonas mediterranea]WCN12655.1 C4-dicarboxylate ABC transporter substrate-binding protein [Marinomonas mediterranea]
MGYKSKLFAGVASLSLLAAQAFAAGSTRLEIQSAWPLTLPASGASAEHFAKQLEVSGADSLKVRLYSAGKLVPSLQIFDAVQQGTLNAGYTSPLYVAGRFPAVQLFGGVPFGPDALEYVGWIYNGGGLDIWREIYAKQGVVTVPCGIMDSEAGGWYKFEINSIDDLKGKKIRFAGLAGEVMKKSGASVVLLGGGDIYPNLERGVIDGTEFSMPAIDAAMGFEKVAPYYYLPGWHQPAAITELIINKRKWDRMSAQQHALIENACKDTMLWTVTSTSVANSEAIEKFKAAGTEIKSFPPSVLEKFKSSTDEVLKEQSEKNADFKRVLDSLNAYREKVALWSKNRS